MVRPYDLLESVLIDVEKGIGEGINEVILAKKHFLSERHLRRVFKFAFNQPLAGYIRSRKLAASLDDLLKTELNVLDIALKYGFSYEQSYIYAFRREFGITPGDLRKTGHIVRVKPPLHLFDENRLSNGLLFGPDIVMVPLFHCVGKRYRLPFSTEDSFAAELGKKFLLNERKQIISTINSSVYIGILKKRNIGDEYTEYMPAVQVENFKNVPQGFDRETIDASLCVRFRYIGQHSYYELNSGNAKELFERIYRFAHNEHLGYDLLSSKIHFERIDERLCDTNYCQMEWYAPITVKSSDFQNGQFVLPYCKDKTENA